MSPAWLYEQLKDWKVENNSKYERSSVWIASKPKKKSAHSNIDHLVTDDRVHVVAIQDCISEGKIKGEWTFLDMNGSLTWNKSFVLEPNWLHTKTPDSMSNNQDITKSKPLKSAKTKKCIKRGLVKQNTSNSKPSKINSDSVNKINKGLRSRRSKKFDEKLKEEKIDTNVSDVKSIQKPTTLRKRTKLRLSGESSSAEAMDLSKRRDVVNKTILRVLRRYLTNQFKSFLSSKFTTGEEVEASKETKKPGNKNKKKEMLEEIQTQRKNMKDTLWETNTINPPVDAAYRRQLTRNNMDERSNLANLNISWPPSPSSSNDDNSECNREKARIIISGTAYSY